jgi:hypothetical protein
VLPAQLQTPSLTEACPICGRELGTVSVDRHHLVPKSKGGREQFLVHKICHRKLHATFTEKQLAREFSTWQAIKAHPAIAEFILWVQKKDPSYYSGSNDARTKRR